MSTGEAASGGLTPLAAAVTLDSLATDIHNQFDYEVGLSTLRSKADKAEAVRLLDVVLVEVFSGAKVAVLRDFIYRQVDREQ